MGKRWAFAVLLLLLAVGLAILGILVGNKHGPDECQVGKTVFASSVIRDDGIAALEVAEIPQGTLGSVVECRFSGIHADSYELQILWRVPETDRPVTTYFTDPGDITFDTPPKQ